MRAALLVLVALTAVVAVTHSESDIGPQEGRDTGRLFNRKLFA